MSNRAKLRLHNISIQRRVKRGARWLDKRLPGWWNGHGLINLHGLNMGNCSMCMLGQLEEPLRGALRLEYINTLGDEGYQRVLKGLYPNAERNPYGSFVGAPDRFAILMGFELDYDHEDRDDQSEGTEDYRTLTNLWREEIMSRRGVDWETA